MPRPLKYRRIASVPAATYFKPAGIRMKDLLQVRMSVDEAEALRLKDIEGLDQEECAVRMNVSRPTFQRVLSSARRTVADALLNGKAILIEGGAVGMASNRFRCRNGHEWALPFEALGRQRQPHCPECSTVGTVLAIGSSGEIKP